MRAQYEWRYLRAGLASVVVFAACAYEPPTVDPNAAAASSSSGSGGRLDGATSSSSSGEGGHTSTGGSGGGEAGAGGSNSGVKAVVQQCGEGDCVITGAQACCVSAVDETCNAEGSCGAAIKVLCDDKADCGDLYCCHLTLSNSYECGDNCAPGSTVCKTKDDCAGGLGCIANRCVSL